MTEKYLNPKYKISFDAYQIKRFHTNSKKDAIKRIRQQLLRFPYAKATLQQVITKTKNNFNARYKIIETYQFEQNKKTRRYTLKATKTIYKK